MHFIGCITFVVGLVVVVHTIFKFTVKTLPDIHRFTIDQYIVDMQEIRTYPQSVYLFSAGKVETTTSTYKYKMQVEEAAAPQNQGVELQNQSHEEGVSEEKVEPKEGDDTSDPPAEQSVSQDTMGEDKQEQEEEATES